MNLSNCWSILVGAYLSLFPRSSTRCPIVARFGGCYIVCSGGSGLQYLPHFGFECGHKKMFGDNFPIRSS